MTVVCLKGVMALLKNEGEERDCKGYVCESKVNSKDKHTLEALKGITGHKGI